MNDSVCIAGLGLIGGSLGMALRRRGWRVSYVDPAVPLEDARAAGAADERRAAAAGPLIVLATPVDVAIEQLRALSGTGALVTSVCSVMQPLRAPAGVEFVAGHPFAGSEKSGLAAADAGLFEGRPWFLARSEPRLERMAAAAGASPRVIDPAEHDRVLALTSHLPQALSTALGSLLAGVDPMLVGSGARSLLRLAGSSYEVWDPVLRLNRVNVERAIDELVATLRRLSADDFERARKTAAEMESRESGVGNRESG